MAILLIVGFYGLCTTVFRLTDFSGQWGAPHYAITAVATVCAVFAVCSIIDRLRLLTVEPLFMRCVDRLLNYKISKH